MLEVITVRKMPMHISSAKITNDMLDLWGSRTFPHHHAPRKHRLYGVRVSNWMVTLGHAWWLKWCSQVETAQLGYFSLTQPDVTKNIEIESCFLRRFHLFVNLPSNNVLFLVVDRPVLMVCTRSWAGCLQLPVNILYINSLWVVSAIVVPSSGIKLPSQSPSASRA